jgi:hypothetical protein
MPCLSKTFEAVLILACGHEIIHKTATKYYINWFYVMILTMFVCLGGDN